MNIIKSSKEDAIIFIKECGKPPMMVKFYADPTHRNSTDCNNGKHNITKSDDVDLKPVPKNPYDPKDPNEKDKEKEKEKEKEPFTLPLDDRSLYLDDGDFYRNMKADLIIAYQNRNRNIIVPRSIPLKEIKIPKKDPPTPAPVIPKKEEVKSEEDELVIPVQNRNPGVIKKDDELAIQKILNDNKIKKPCTGNGNTPIISDPKYIDYPKYKNFTEIINE